MEPPNTFSESRNLFSQSEGWIEAASWIVEEKRARLSDDPTEEAFARLVFELCVRRTQDLESR
jgi:hypothetical protein